MTGPVVVLTGTYGAARAGAAGQRRTNERTCVRAVPNDFFGGNIGVAGLLTGAGRARRAGETSATNTRYLLPDACLNEGRFLDGPTLADLPAPGRVVPTDGPSLRAALDGRSYRPTCAA